MQKLLIRALVDRGYVMKGDFTLSSGSRSEWYVNIKGAVLDPVVEPIIGSMLLAAVADMKPRSVGCDEGPGPCALMGLFAEDGYQGFIIRKPGKGHGIGRGHGTGEGIIGRVIDPYVIIDDVITEGNSVLRIINEVGIRPVAVFIIVDRQAGGSALLEQREILCKSLVTMDDLVRYYAENTCPNRGDIKLDGTV